MPTMPANNWGLALVVLAVLGFAALLSPPSMRALTTDKTRNQPR